MHSIVASSALVPRVASSSTAFTVFRRDVTLVTMTCQRNGEVMSLTVGPGEPMLVAPSLTTSVSCVMVLAEDWAAWDSFSWLDAAPATSSLVSSTSALAVFKMLSLRDGTRRVTICSKCSSRGEHDGGVQVSDDAGYGAGRRDTGLGAFVPRLQC
ncbi:hypothetical protein EYF80_032762 [Liparis tanakae]|uniref:Uncharacterized protein n=1 Tax=Liparis tanakae TaxID=230148 RepID=A0A4Z2GUL3_9TELE|nr:hypothetical protein EYF80_032762 [Liparis tanakae]